MILKEIEYNQYSVSINDLGGIYIINNKELFLIINIADLPIINELTKDLLEYYVEWNKQKKFVEKMYYKEN